MTIDIKMNNGNDPEYEIESLKNQVSFLSEIVFGLKSEMERFKEIVPLADDKLGNHSAPQNQT